MESRRIDNRLQLSPFFYRLLQKFVHGDYEDLQRMLDAGYAPFFGRPVLELGCGTGSLSKFFPPDLYTGVDIDGDRITEARNLYPGVPFVKSDVSSLPRSFFDPFPFIFCHAWIHHIDDQAVFDIFATIERAAVDSPKQLLILEPVLPESFWRNPIGFILAKADRGRYVRTIKHMRDLAGNRLHSLTPVPGKWQWPVPGVIIEMRFGD